MSEPDIEILTPNEFRIFVTGKLDALEAHLNRMESDLKTRLDKIDENLKGLDEDIRGNGKDGIIVRLDRLEKWKNGVLIVVSIVITALLGGFFAHYFELLGK